MKHQRLFWFLSLLICVSLACSLPGTKVPQAGDVAQVESINITSTKGTSSFSAVVEGTTINGVPSKLVCYVTPDKANQKFSGDVTGNTNIGWSFTKSFTFTEIDPGTHSLVCLINDESLTSWSQDFTVDSQPILTITASSATMTFGSPYPGIEPSYTGFLGSDTEYSLAIRPRCDSDASKVLMVGSFRSSCSGASSDTYTFNYVDGSIQVNKALLTITASSATMTEGGTVPTITPTYSGFVFSQTESALTLAPNCSTTATNTSPAGTYPSSCSCASAIDYSISYIAGSVTVTPATPTNLTLNGSFKLPEEDGTCPDGSVSHDSATAITGTLVLKVDYKSGEASVTLQGTNTATVENWCTVPSHTETWTIKGVTLTGTIDSKTNTLTVAGDVPIDLADGCQIIDETNGGACIAGTQILNSKITLKGKIDPAKSTGSGQITYTGYTSWGAWQAP